MGKKNKKSLNPGGVNRTGKGIVNINSEDYIALQKAVRSPSQNQTEEEKLKYGLLSLKYQMESYIAQKKPSVVVEVGEFLKKHLELIHIKNKTFAKYIGLEESNLSSILRGRRKVNIDLACKLGKIFHLNPDIWLLVQSKNDLLKVNKAQQAKYDQFKLEDLLKKAS